MSNVIQKPAPAVDRREAALRAERERLDAIEADMRAGNYVTWDEWKRKNGYDSTDK